MAENNLENFNPSNQSMPLEEEKVNSFDSISTILANKPNSPFESGDLRSQIHHMLNNQSPGTTFKRFELRPSLKDKGWDVATINHLIEYNGLSLEELRAVDYQNVRAGSLPDNWKVFVAQKIEEARASEINLIRSNSGNQSAFLGEAGGTGFYDVTNNNGLLNSAINYSGEMLFFNSSFLIVYIRRCSIRGFYLQRQQSKRAWWRSEWGRPEYPC